MPSTRLARAYKNVFWLDDRGDKGPCRRVGAKLMSRASSMKWHGPAPSTQEPSFLGDSQCVIVEKPTATPAVQQLDVEPEIVETRWPPGHVIVRTYMPIARYCTVSMPIGNRDASLLSMACLILAINCMRIQKCLLAGRPKRQGPL